MKNRPTFAQARLDAITSFCNDIAELTEEGEFSPDQLATLADAISMVQRKILCQLSLTRDIVPAPQRHPIARDATFWPEQLGEKMFEIMREIHGDPHYDARAMMRLCIVAYSLSESGAEVASTH